MRPLALSNASFILRGLKMLNRLGLKDCFSQFISLSPSSKSSGKSPFSLAVLITSSDIFFLSFIYAICFLIFLILNIIFLSYCPMYIGTRIICQVLFYMLFPPWVLRELPHNFQVSDHLYILQVSIVTPTCTTEQQTKTFVH